MPFGEVPRWKGLLVFAGDLDGMGRHSTGSVEGRGGSGARYHVGVAEALFGTFRVYCIAELYSSNNFICTFPDS